MRDGRDVRVERTRWGRDVISERLIMLDLDDEDGDDDLVLRRKEMTTVAMTRMGSCRSVDVSESMVREAILILIDLQAKKKHAMRL